MELAEMVTYKFSYSIDQTLYAFESIELEKYRKLVKSVRGGGKRFEGGVRV